MVTAGAFQNVAPGSSNSGAKPTFLDDQLDYVQSMMQIDDNDDFEYRRPDFYKKVEEDGKTEEVVSDGPAQRVTHPAVGQGEVYPRSRDTGPTGNASSAPGN